MARPLSLQVQDLADDAIERIENWERVLLNFASAQEPFTEAGFLGHELKAACVVASMGELEHFLVECLVGLCAEINSSSTRLKELRPSLRPLAAHSSFVSLSSTSNAENVYSRRAVVTSLELSNEYAQLPRRVGSGPQPPLDGKTITGAHLSRVWRIIGLEGTPFPAATTEAALKKLAGMRNDVAHRNIPLKELFSQPDTSARHVLAYLSELTALFGHVAAAMSAYARSRQYRVEQAGQAAHD